MMPAGIGPFKSSICRVTSVIASRSLFGFVAILASLNATSRAVTIQTVPVGNILVQIRPRRRPHVAHDLEVRRQRPSPSLHVVITDGDGKVYFDTTWTVPRRK
jgi:hypothetical protein